MRGTPGDRARRLHLDGSQPPRSPDVLGDVPAPRVDARRRAGSCRPRSRLAPKPLVHLLSVAEVEPGRQSPLYGDPTELLPHGTAPRPAFRELSAQAIGDEGPQRPTELCRPLSSRKAG